MHRFVTLTVVAALTLTACRSEEAEVDPTDTSAAPAISDIQTAGEPTLVSTLAENAELSTLLTAVEAAGLDSTLSAEGPFTVFAPTNAAFDALGEGVVTDLATNQTERLNRILTYHVLPNRTMSGDIAGSFTIETMGGDGITVSSENGEVTVTDAQGGTATVVTADQDVANGVIHTIDAVLMPSNE